ncbi:TM198 protein, partial [Bucco capensis]|nr:TM198 protein [Bucco capensis]
GYRCFKAILFLSGLLLGSAVIFLLCYKQQVLDSSLSLEASAGLALAIGLLCGLLTLLLRSVGLFTTGVLLGLLLATAALPLAALALPPSPWVPAGGSLGLALLCALLALRWPKALTVLATALLGAAAVVLCADHLAQASALARHVAQRLRLAPRQPLCWPGWLLLGAWLLLGLLASVVQWKVTAHGIDHSDGALRRQRKQLQLLRLRQSPGLPEGSHRRKPPP